MYFDNKGVNRIEEWEKVINIKNEYLISSIGRVISLNYNHTKKPRMLKQKFDKNGYLLVTLFDGYSKNVKVHRLVAIAFIPNPENKPEVNHKGLNGDKTDNRVCSLEWNTNLENIRHAINTGLKDIKGEKNNKAKLKEWQVLEIRKSILKSTELASMFNVSASTINGVKRRQFWNHV